MDKYQPCPYMASCVYRHFHVNIAHHPLKSDLLCCAFSLRQLSYATCNIVQSHGLFAIAKLLVLYTFISAHLLSEAISILLLSTSCTSVKRMNCVKTR